MRIAFTTLGCKVNQFDTAVMAEGLLKQSHRVVAYDDSADLYVINTCTVTENADLESRQWVKKAQRMNPNAKIIVTGCYAQTNPTEVMKIPGVTLVLGNEEKKEISSYIHLLDSTPEEPISCVGDMGSRKLFKQGVLEGFLDKTRAFLKIQDGCNSRCSFCIIPKARGRSRSFASEEVIGQIKLFEERGYREVVFSGINLGSYGSDFRPKSSLATLIRQIEKETRAVRFRFSSIEPELFSEELINIFSESSRVCHHFHVPLQSGDSEILKKMGRKYAVDQYRILIEKLYRVMPDASLGADIMVGFPGETRTAFWNSYNFVSMLPLSYLHVFSYSPREGTESWDFSGSVPSREKRERASLLRQLSMRMAERYRRRFIGKTLDLIIEDSDAGRFSGTIRGMSGNYLRVLVNQGKDLKPKDLVRVLIDSEQDGYLIGIPIPA